MDDDLEDVRRLARMLWGNVHVQVFRKCCSSLPWRAKVIFDEQHPLYVYTIHEEDASSRQEAIELLTRRLRFEKENQ